MANNINNVEVAKGLIPRWIQGEEGFQEKNLQMVCGDELDARRQFLTETYLPQKWTVSAEVRPDCTLEALDRSNQLILKVLAAYRAMLVCDLLQEGISLESAAETTSGLLKATINPLRSEDLPPRLWLYEPEFDQIFGPEPLEGFEMAARLAITGTVETVHRLPADCLKVRLPLPGVPTAVRPINAWLTETAIV